MRPVMLALTAALAASGFAAQAKDATKITTQPDWIERPQAEDLSEAYPEIANALEIEGRVNLACTTDSFGKLEGCRAVDVMPSGLGFEAAALSMAPLFQMRPMTIDGAPTDGGRVTIPIRFRPLPAAETEPPRVNDTPAFRVARRFVDLSNMARLLETDFAKKADLLEFIEADGVAPEVRGDAANAMRAAIKSLGGELRDRLAIAAVSAFDAEDLAELVRVLDGPDGAYFRLNPSVMAVSEMLERDFYPRARLVAHETYCVRNACDPSPALRVAVDAILQEPPWTEAPGQEEIDAMRPSIASNLALDGAARLRCVVDTRATLKQCAIVADSPSGVGFGQAALSLAPRFRLEPRLMAQGAEGESLAVTLLFRAPDMTASFEPPAPRSEASLQLARKVVGYDAEAFRRTIAIQEQEALGKPPEGADPALYAQMLAAWSEGVAQASDWRAEGMARTLASVYSDRELAAAAAFKKAFAGREIDTKASRFSAAAGLAAEVMSSRIGRTAQAAFCRTRTCGPAKPLSPSP